MAGFSLIDKKFQAFTSILDEIFIINTIIISERKLPFNGLSWKGWYDNL